MDIFYDALTKIILLFVISSITVIHCIFFKIETEECNDNENGLLKQKTHFFTVVIYSCPSLPVDIKRVCQTHCIFASNIGILSKEALIRIPIRWIFQTEKYKFNFFLQILII